MYLYVCMYHYCKVTLTLPTIYSNFNVTAKLYRVSAKIFNGEA